jgi:hypothetical protein
LCRIAGREVNVAWSHETRSAMVSEAATPARPLTIREQRVDVAHLPVVPRIYVRLTELNLGD